MPSCATQARPSWNAVTVRLAGMSADPSMRPAEVDGEEARAVQRRGGAERERRRRQRRDRVQARRREPHARERLLCERADGEPREQADHELLGEQHEHVGQPVVGLLDPLDEPEHEQHRDRVVEARLALQGAFQAPPEPRPAQQGEHRRAVRGGHDRAEQQALEQREVEQPGGGEARDDRGDQRPGHRERDRGPQHRPDLAPARREAALEEDQRQRDDADGLGEVVVVERDPAQPVRAHEHPDPEEQHEAGQPQAAGDQGGGEGGGKERADDEDCRAVVQSGSMSADLTRASCRPARSRRRP